MNNDNNNNNNTEPKETPEYEKWLKACEDYAIHVLKDASREWPCGRYTAEGAASPDGLFEAGSKHKAVGDFDRFRRKVFLVFWMKVEVREVEDVLYFRRTRAERDAMLLILQRIVNCFERVALPSPAQLVVDQAKAVLNHRRIFDPSDMVNVLSSKMAILDLLKGAVEMLSCLAGEDEESCEHPYTALNLIRATIRSVRESIDLEENGDSRLRQLEMYMPHRKPTLCSLLAEAECLLRSARELMPGNGLGADIDELLERLSIVQDFAKTATVPAASESIASPAPSGEDPAGAPPWPRCEREAGEVEKRAGFARFCSTCGTACRYAGEEHLVICKHHQFAIK